MRNLGVRFQVGIYAIEHDPFAIRRRHRRADALQFHHVLECEWTLLRWRLREGGETDEQKSWNQKLRFHIFVDSAGVEALGAASALYGDSPFDTKAATTFRFFQFSYCAPWLTSKSKQSRTVLT